MATKWKQVKKKREENLDIFKENNIHKDFVNTFDIYVTLASNLNCVSCWFDDISKIC